MTQEEIKKRLFEISTSNFNSVVDFGAYSAGYMDGAKWADRTMLEKACEWLDENMNDVGIRFMRGDEIKDIVDLFRKAMKGD